MADRRPRAARTILPFPAGLVICPVASYVTSVSLAMLLPICGQQKNDKINGFDKKILYKKNQKVTMQELYNNDNKKSIYLAQLLYEYALLRFIIQGIILLPPLYITELPL